MVAEPQNSLFWYETKRKWLAQSHAGTAAAASPLRRTYFRMRPSMTRRELIKMTPPPNRRCARRRVRGDEASTVLARGPLHRPALRRECSRCHKVTYSTAANAIWPVPGRRDAIGDATRHLVAAKDVMGSRDRRPGYVRDR